MLELSGIAARFAGDTDQQNAIYQSLRTLHRAGLIRGADRKGDRGAWRFPPEEALAASILLSALEDGGGIEYARILRKALDADLNPVAPYPPSMRNEHGDIQYKTLALSALVEGLKAGETWTILVRSVRYGGGALQREARVQYPGAPEPSHDMDAFFGRIAIKEMRLYLSDLFAPVADLFAK